MARVTTAKPYITAPIELPGSGHVRKGDLSVYDKPAGRGEMARRAKVAKFVAAARKEFLTADAASASFRGKMRIDQRFAAGGGNQWDPVDRQQRADEGRPCLEINRIPQFIRQVSNQNRMSRSQIKIDPRGSGATREQAWAIQGIVRSIEVESDADVVYDTATEHQLRSGIGFVRLKVAWANRLKGLTRVCRLARIRNPLSVYWDPSTQEADFGDMRYLTIVGVLGKDEYDARWGKVSSYASLSEYMRADSSLNDWAPEGKVVVAERFYVEIEKRTLLQMTDGAEVWQDELDMYLEAFQQSYPDQPAPGVHMEREIDKPVVRWALHNGVDILEGNEDRTAGREVPGTRIPIFPVIGDELDLDGTVDYRGMVRDGIDPARMYNFWTSSIAEAVALAPKAPWIAAAGQINEYLDDWKTANRVPHAVLQYDPKAIEGLLVPAPERNVAEPAIAAMVSGLRESDSDLKAVMGLFEPSLGQKGPQQSGKAITAMQQQGEIANSNYLDNLQRTKRSIGRTLVNEWIPAVYDVATLMHLEMPNGKMKQMVVYAGEQNKPQEGSFGDVTEFYDISVGEFSIEIDTGPSYKTQQEATEAWLLDLFKVVPQLAAIGADILLENADNPAAQQLAERYKATLPPQFQDQDSQGAKLQQLMTENAQLKQHAQIAHNAITKMAEVIDTQEISARAKIEVAAIQAEASVQVASVKAGSASVLQAADHAAGHFTDVIGQLHEAALGEVEHGQNLEAQSEQAKQAQEQQEQQAAQQAALGAQGAGQKSAQADQAAGHASAQADRAAGHAQALQKQKAALATKPGPGSSAL